MRFKIWKERIKLILGFSSRKMEHSSICGIKLKTVKGTVRKKLDQDDAWFFALAKHNDIIFDIGSNVGYNALLAMVQNPDRSYLLVDPNPLALSAANLNLMSNSLGRRAMYYSAFVSDKMGDKVKFYTVGTGAAGSMYRSHAKTASSLNSWFYVDSITIDYLSNYYNKIPDLVKIDVEGAESLVLHGAIELAKKTRTLFFVEMHATEELSMYNNAISVLDWCGLVEYTAYYMTNAKEMEDANEIAHRGKCHLLLIPQHLEYPIYLKEIKQYNLLPDKI